MLSRKLVVEFIGTFFLVLAIGLTANPYAIGLTLAALVYFGGAISGAHYNPAVTFAVFLARKITGRQAWAYIGAQFSGGVAAVLVFLMIKGTHLQVRPGAGVGDGMAILVEAIFTFLLVSTILQVAISKRQAGNQYFGLAIGLSLLVGAVAAGAISGGAYNPVAGITPALISQTNVLSSIVIYTAGPLLGATLAAFGYRFLEKKNDKA